MGQDGRFERWAGVVLGVVSLILALHLSKSYVLPLLDSHARTSALRSDSASRSTSPNHAETESDSQTTQIQTLRLRKESPKAVTGQDSVRPRERAGSQASGNSEAAESTRNATEKAVAASPEPDVEKTSVEVAKAVAAPLSPTRTFETIGYVEKPDGTKQAIVSKGDQVFVVHEGETFDEHYRVLSITSSEVEAADLTVPQFAPVATPEPTVLAKQSNSPAAKRPAEKLMPAMAEAKPLGFVERAGRPPEAIVPDGDTVRLVASSAISGIGSEGDQASVSSRDGISPAPSTNKPTLSDAVLVAQTETSDGATGVPRSSPDNTQVMASPILELQPPPKAVENFDSSRLTGGSFQDVSMRGSPEGLSLTRAGPAKPSRQTFKAFCYVERPTTGREAFVAFGETVYSVREGTIIADRFRVVGIRPEGVEVEDVTIETRPPPWPNQEVAQNRKLPDDPSELGNHSPPAALPMSSLARSVAFLLTDFATSEVVPGAEPRQLAQNPGEPTNGSSLPSTSNVRVGPDQDTAVPSLTQVFGPKDDGVSFGETDPDKSGYATEPSVGTVANKLTRDPATREIALLRLNVSPDLLSLPGQDGAATTVRNPLADRPPIEASNGPLSPPASNGALRGSQKAGGLQTVHSPVLMTTSLPEISSISGRDLLLHFSIGDNGCYFP